jgi:hypothetical protein
MLLLLYIHDYMRGEYLTESNVDITKIMYWFPHKTYAPISPNLIYKLLSFSLVPAHLRVPAGLAPSSQRFIKSG